MRGYFRFQLDLSRGTGEMDDASNAHLEQLIDLTQDYLGQPDTRDNLSRVSELLA
jgi:hypothetical protein